MNISATETIDLTGVSLVQVDLAGDLQGIDFTFAADGPIIFLRPGERIVLVENTDAFRRRYGPAPRIAGQYHNALSNDGERITLLDHAGDPIRVFTYNDQLPWPTAADGDGYSLVLQAPNSNPDVGLNWIPSTAPHGTPGTHDALPFTGGVDEDEDGDGITALVEHALGSNDRDPSSGPDRLGASRSAGKVLFHHTRNLRSENTRIVLQYSNDLSAWQTDPGDGSICLLSDRVHNRDGTETLVWCLPPALEARFVRLRVTALP